MGTGLHLFLRAVRRNQNLHCRLLATNKRYCHICHQYPTFCYYLATSSTSHIMNNISHATKDCLKIERSVTKMLTSVMLTDVTNNSLDI